MHARRFAPLAVIVIGALAAEVSAGTYRGREFPDFTATDALTGKQFSLKDLRGKVVLVDFWATWCGPCVHELPNVSRVYGRYRKQGFEIVSISLDSDRKKFERFARSKRMTWYHVMEGGGWKTRLARKYGINSIPAMFVLDPDGVCIAENARGRQLESAIKRGLEMVEKEPPPRAPEREQRRPERRTAPPPPPPPARPIELVAAREQLAAIAAPLQELDRGLASLEATIADLQAQLPAPRNTRAAREQVELALDGLADARQVAFLMGLLDGRAAPPVPPNPLEAAPDDPRSWSRAVATLETAQASIGDIRAAAGDVTARLGDLGNDIRDLERELSRGRDAGDRVEAIEARIADLAEELDEPWAGQVESARLIVAECCLPFDEAQARLDGLDSRIEAVRATVVAEPRDTDSLRALRADFRSVCADLASLGALIDPDGDVVTTLPSDPFDGRRLKDRRVLTAMASQVVVAGDAVAALRGRIVERRQRFDTLIERVAAVQRDLDDRLEAGESLDGLREQFREISREVLALHDPVVN